MVSKMRVCVYTRCSTDAQAKAKSTDLQIEQIERYCKYGKHEIVMRYNDEARSGANINMRSEFQRLMRDAEQHRFEAVVVSKLDRFGRSVRDLVDSLDRLKNLNIGFISTGDNIDTTTPNGRLLFHILSAFAEFEREVIRERMLAGKEKARREGRLVHRPKKELNLEQLKELYCKNKLTVRGCAKFFGVHPSTISARLREMGVEIRKI